MNSCLTDPVVAPKTSTPFEAPKRVEPVRVKSPEPEAPKANYLQRADQAYASGDLLSACRFLEEGLRLDPKDVDLLLCLGNLQFQLNNFAAALQNYTLARSLHPRDADVLTRLAVAAHRCDQTALAEAALAEALEISPAHPVALQLRGDLYRNRQCYAEAALNYCAALESNSNSIPLLSALGKCEYELHDGMSARWCFERVLAVDPANAIAVEALELLENQRSTQAASQNRNEALSSLAGDGSVQDLVGLTLLHCDDCLHQSDFLGAWRALGRAVTLAPKRTDLLNHRGRLALVLKDLKSALRDFKSALALEPENIPALSGLARYYMLERDWAEAATAADRVLSFDPTDEEALQVRRELQFQRRTVGTATGSSKNLDAVAPKDEGAAVIRSEDRVFVQERLPGIEGWLSDGAALFTLFLFNLQDRENVRGSAFEIGVFKGKYLSALYQGTHPMGDPVAGVDVFRWSTIEETVVAFDKAFGEHDRLQLIKDDSRNLTRDDVLRAVRGVRPRFISVDGDHKGDAVCADLVFSGSLLADRGVIAIDDFLNPQAIGASEGSYRFLLGPGAVEYKPFAFCQNKLFVCRTANHAHYLDASWRFAQANRDLAMVQKFHELLRNGRNWVEQDLLSTRCLIL